MTTTETSRFFSTREEAMRAGKPAGKDSWVLWEITGPNGEHFFGYSGGAAVILAQVVMRHGWKSRKADGKNGLSVQEQVKSMNADQRVALLLDGLTPEQQREVMAKLLPAAQPAPAEEHAKPRTSAAKK